ncbi:MAG: amidase [Actinobacteria bacterium]|nr:amidase [Actinomycetota bacterium]
MEPNDVTAAAEAVRTGEVSARELVEVSLERIDRGDGALRAFVHLDPEGALAAADRIDDARRRGEDLGPLAGVPFGVKDLEDCAGMPTTRGSRWYADAPPATRDDLHVERFCAAGAIPVGKTATPEFGAWGYTASPLLGVTRNPWRTDRTPGGSSGGTAAAVSAGFVPFGTASDGGGSIRGPAASCGLPGLKPTYGRVPSRATTRLAQNAVNFALAAAVRDTALLLDVAAGPHPLDRTSHPAPGVRYTNAAEQLDVAGLRATWTADLGFVVVDPEVERITAAAAEQLVAAADLERRQFGPTFDDYILTYVFMEGADQFVDVPEDWADRLDELDPLAVRSWEHSAATALPTFAWVERDRRVVEQQVAKLFEGTDLLLTPTNGCPPFAAEGPMPEVIGGRECHAGHAALLTMLANLANLPSISLPAGTTADGLPVGLMVTAPRHREDLCLRIARIWEQTHPWPRFAPGYPSQD